MKIIVELGVYMLLMSVIILAIVAIPSNIMEIGSTTPFSPKQRFSSLEKQRQMGVYMFLLGIIVIITAIVFLVIYFVFPKKPSKYRYF